MRSLSCKFFVGNRRADLVLQLAIGYMV